MESPTPQFTPVEQPKKSNTGLIIGIVVVVLLCCCCLVIIGGLTILGPAVKSSVNQQLTAMPQVPSMPSGTSEPSSPSVPSVPSSMVPQGGLGDDIERATAWGYVITSAALSGCSATDASKTSIDVLQQPDSTGMWKEKWTVTCDDGTKKSFDVSITPNKNGSPDIKVTDSK